MNIRSFHLGRYLLIALCAINIGVTEQLSAGQLTPHFKEILASDSSPHDNYGIIVALSGDTAVVGVPFDRSRSFNAGSVYVFSRHESEWHLQQRLFATDSAPGDQFGWSLALQNDTLFVGARFDDDKGFNSGSTYIFTRNDGVWSEQQKLNAADGSVNDQYGATLSLAGDTAIIGAPFDDDGGFDSGSAYVYTLVENHWTLQQKLTTRDATPGDQYGWAVALQDNQALIGARFDDDRGFNSGSAYLYSRHAEGWIMQQKLTTTDGAINDQFGWAVDLDGDTAVIGARFDDDSGINSGSAYIYQRGKSGWQLQQKLTASDGQPGNQYSWSIALQQNTIIIGAPFDNNSGQLSGSSYIYTRDAVIWHEKQKLTADNRVTGDRFGISVALGHNNLIVGGCLDTKKSIFPEPSLSNTNCQPFLYETTSLTFED